MKWLLSFLAIVVTTAIGWLLDAFFGAPIRSWSQRQIRKAWDGRVRLFVRRKTFDDYFAFVGADRVDYVVYQLGLRPKIPLVDLLYFEFLHSLLVANRAERILLFPSIDLTYPWQEKKDFEEFRSNVIRVLRKYESQICIVDPFSVTINTADLLSVPFLETLKFVGSREFITFVRDTLNLRVGSFCDFNKYHPEDIRLLAIYVHLVRGWIIWNYLRERSITDRTHVNLGFIIWETEVDKLGLFRQISRKAKNMTLTPILGKTILWGKNKTIPVFEYKKTLGIFDDVSDVILKLASKDDKEVGTCIKILDAILTENYQDSADLNAAYKQGEKQFKQYKISSRKGLADVNKLTKKGYIALYLMHRLQAKYGDM